MSLSVEEKKILKRMDEIRLLENGIDDIEEYEQLASEILEFHNIDCIPELCAIMDDNAGACSAVESVLEVILLLMKQNTEKISIVLDKIMEGTERMQEHGMSWARILHIQILRDESLIPEYIQCLKRAIGNGQKVALEILYIINEKKILSHIDLNDTKAAEWGLPWNTI